jgi:hypothetical protein
MHFTGFVQTLFTLTTNSESKYVVNHLQSNSFDSLKLNFKSKTQFILLSNVEMCCCI